jgi:S-adenosylmethionine uptake transporter
MLAIVLAAAAFSSMDAAIKALAPRYGTLQLTFIRFASGLVFALGVWLAWRTALPRSGKTWRLHFARAALLMLTLALYFYALSVLPLAQAVTMGYAAPIFTALLAMAVLHERPDRRIWLALGFGAAGAVVAMWPELAASRSTVLVGLLAAGGSAVTFAGVVVLTRQQAQRDELPTFLLVQNLLPTLLLAAPAVAWFWQPLHAPDYWLAGLVGLLSTIGLSAFTWAFRHAQASRLAPLEYVGLLWAALLGYFAFGEVPSFYTVSAAALIIGGSLLLLRR